MTECPELVVGLVAVELVAEAAVEVGSVVAAAVVAEERLAQAVHHLPVELVLEAVAGVVRTMQMGRR